MPRRTVDVVPVDRDDLRDVTGLWLAARVDSGSSKEAANRCVTDGRLTTALLRPGVQAFVARLDGEAVGYAITTENPFGLSPQAELAIEQLLGRARRPAARGREGPHRRRALLRRAVRLRARRVERAHHQP